MRPTLKFFIFLLVVFSSNIDRAMIFAEDSKLVDQTSSDNRPKEENNGDLLQNDKEEILKNPFQSQLPQPKVVVKVEPVVQQPIPQPVVAAAPVAPVTPQVKPPSFTISGLVWNCPRPEAIVNQQIVSVGDTIDNWTVVAINESEIEVQSSGVSFTVHANFDDAADGKKL